MEYIQKPQNKNDECVFCAAQAVQDGLKNLILFRGHSAYIILNRYPYTSGHLMIVPYAHQPSLDQLERDTRSEMMELATLSLQLLETEYHPEGFNIGLNIGEAAGAGILDHIHLHVVPRWNGDTNFMSSLGFTRVLPESLDDTYTRLKRAWNNLDLSNKVPGR